MSIQSDILSGKYMSIWSYIHILENEVNPYDDVKKSIAKWGNELEAYCGPSDIIYDTGYNIMNNGIKRRDALHLACALPLYITE
ncbi:MAG: hypothetical protein FWG21_03210 [Oscillospiraceae bacterium]|nr:hypothetical protein [Oscillospiraceae bacterium]